MKTFLRPLITITLIFSLASSVVVAAPRGPTKKELRKAKIQKTVTDIGRGLGIGSSVLTLGTARGFGAVTGFFTGMIKKRSPENEQMDRLLTFMMKKEQRKRLDEAVKTTGTLEDMNIVLIEEMVDILQEKLDLVSLQVLKEIAPEYKDCENLEQVNWLKVDFSKLSVDMLTHNKDYQELKFLAGDFEDREFLRLYRYSYHGVPRLENINRPGTYTNVDESLETQFSEGFAGISFEGFSSILIDVLVPTSVMAATFAPLAAAYAIPISLGMVGTGISWWQCMKPKSELRIAMVEEGPESYENEAQYQKDLGLKKFCMRVVTHPYFKFVVTRTQGYLAGRKVKTWFQKAFKSKKKKSNIEYLQQPALD